MTERVLVDGPTFFVTDERFRTGDAGGLFHRDTRYLSELSVSLSDADLSLIGSDLLAPWRRVVTSADVASAVNEVDDAATGKHTTVTAVRDQVVADGLGLVERVTVSNHSPAETDRSVSVSVDADFSDLFEVRGLNPGIDREVERSVGDDAIRFGYDPPDVDRASAVTVGFDPAPERLTADAAVFDRTLPSQTSTTVTLAALPTPAGVADDDGARFDAVRRSDDGDRSDGDGQFGWKQRLDGTRPRGEERSPFERALDRAGDSVLGSDGSETATATVSDPLFRRAGRDLEALVTETQHGPVPVAGVPWFATVFGRDALLTAYNVIHATPSLAEGTLRYLAAHQGTETSADREEAPGKIFHEIRHGELARRGDIPHTPYYGTVDATPLWLVVLDETRRWTGDDGLVDDLWDNARAAASWIATAVDAVGDDPFLYYTASDGVGLAHKAWRDTARSVQFTDGEPADPPLATVEVQGYIYDAFRRMASLAEGRGDDERADEYARRASAIEARFDEEFWLDDRSYYAAAKTADGRVVASVTSNVGHGLWSGVIPEDRASAVVRTLLGDGLYSGWGVRTMSSEDGGYSPVSYHVGSVWPHDNALAALGARSYGFARAVETIATDVLDACRTFDHQRVPELYCGFDDDHGPYPYPSACEPQAWSASAPFALLRALFDVRPGTDAYATVNSVPDSVDVSIESVVPLLDADRTVDSTVG